MYNLDNDGHFDGIRKNFGPILPIKVFVTIDTVLNFDRHFDIMCKQGLSVLYAPKYQPKYSQPRLKFITRVPTQVKHLKSKTGIRSVWLDHYFTEPEYTSSKNCSPSPSVLGPLFYRGAVHTIEELFAFVQCDSTFIFYRGTVHTVPGWRGDAAEDR